MNCDERYRYSAFTSLAMALVSLWLYFDFSKYVNPVVSLLSFVVFLVDAYAKWTDNRPLRRKTTILYSFANAALILSGFNYVGDPLSKVIAFLWLVDMALKIPGVNTSWEGSFRHVFSALMTVVTGLSLLFTYRVFGSFLLSFVLGILVLGDAYVKLRFVKDRCFVVS